MKSVPLGLCALGVLGALMAADRAAAHHSYSMFDRTKEVTLTGVVKELEWTNPHIFIELVTPDGAASKAWSIEGTSPGVLRRAGWRFDSLKSGEHVTLTMSPLKDGRPGGMLSYVVKEGGQKLYNGRAPEDAK